MSGGEVVAAGEPGTVAVATNERAHDIATSDTRCANCATPLKGEYCYHCGQRYEPHMHSLGEFLNEATETVTHADSRLWRTMWSLLARPGFLTREFFEGRRARYLPPFRLYLVLSVVFFVALLSGRHVQPAYGQLVAKDGKVTTQMTPLGSDANHPNETPEARAERVCGSGTIFALGSEWLKEEVNKSCRRIVVDNGRALAEAMFHNIPRALIVMLPLLALVMRVMYRKRYYVEHLLFFVHTHSFTFLSLTLYVLATRWIQSGWYNGIVTTAMVFWIPAYTWKAMRYVYAQKRWVTCAKYWVLSLAYLFFAVLMAILTSVYSMITL